MLTLENISLSYQNNRVLQKINFSIVPGALMFIKGPNGIGKTSLLKIIAGIIKPTYGIVRWNNVHIYEELNTYHSNIVSYLGIKNALKDNLTVFDNLTFWAKIKNNQELIPIAIKYFNLNVVENVKCGKLSSGMLKRVALARMMIENNNLWIMDEPEVYLDNETKDYLQKLIAVKTREGGIVIISTHSLESNFSQPSVINLIDFSVP